MKEKQLTHQKVQSAKPKEKAYKLSDGKGLYLMIYPNGKKGWRFRYRFKGKEKMLSLGSFPGRGLQEARRVLEDLRVQVENDIDPSDVRKTERGGIQGPVVGSFESIAREWHKLKHSKEVSSGHAQTTLNRLESNVFPWIGKKPINDISPPTLLSVLRRIESRGAYETANRVKSICGQIFRYAVAIGSAERDPTADLRGILAKVNTKHLAAITEPSEVAKLLRAIDGYEGSIITRAALQFAPLVFVRPGELRHAEWSEIDFEKAEWNIPANKMKIKEPFLVPLSDQALVILRDIEPLTGDCRYVFPSPRSFARPMSDNAILAALRRMGYEKNEMTGHGFRAMARTILDEVLLFKPEIIEQQLAHAVKDALGRAYNRTKHLPQRREMMQAWANYLDGLKRGSAKVIPIVTANT